MCPRSAALIHLKPKGKRIFLNVFFGLESFLLGKCFDFAKIVKRLDGNMRSDVLPRHENGVTILLTRASYEVLSGFRVVFQLVFRLVCPF